MNSRTSLEVNEPTEESISCLGNEANDDHDSLSVGKVPAMSPKFMDSPSISCEKKRVAPTRDPLFRIKPVSTHMESKILNDSSIDLDECIQNISFQGNNKSINKSNTTNMPSDIHYPQLVSGKKPAMCQTGHANQFSGSIASRLDTITAKKSFYNCIENVSSLASVGLGIDSQVDLKMVLNSKLQNPLEMDFRTYQGLTEEQRLGSVPSLKSILQDRTPKNRKTPGKSKLGPKEQTSSKRVSFAQNKVLLIYDSQQAGSHEFDD